MLDTLCQTTSKTGTQPHPLAQRLPKIVKRPQTPQNTPRDVGCQPERQDPASSTRTQALLPSTRKPTEPTEPTVATGERHQKQQKLRTCSLQKGDLKHSKISKMRRQRNTQGFVGFLVEGTSACVLVDEAGSCLSGGHFHVCWCVLGCLWTYDFRPPLC